MMGGASPGTLFGSVLHAARRLRGAGLATLLAACLVATAASAWRLNAASQQNAAISALAAGGDVAVDAASAGVEVMLARALFLIERDRFDEAQAISDAAGGRAGASARSRMLYNLANSNVRRAFAAIEAGKPDAAIPLTKLAKDGYREALRLDPVNWDAKYNYDVASRLMRDFPGHEQEGEEVPPDANVKLWTDLPGVPQGAP